FAKHTARPAISTLSLHDALPIWEILAGKGVVATVSGYETNPSLNKRCQGFKEELEKKYPGIEVKDTRYAYNSNAIAENITREMVEQYPDLSGIFITADVEGGVCEA